MDYRNKTKFLQTVISSIKFITPVFGENLSTDTFSPDDIDKLIHGKSENNQFVAILKLRDGRFISISTIEYEEMILEGKILDNTVCYASKTYKNIINLGLGDKERDLLRFELGENYEVF